MSCCACHSHIVTNSCDTFVSVETDVSCQDVTSSVVHKVRLPLTLCLVH